MLSGSTGVQAQYSAPTRLLMHPSQIGVNRMLFLVCTVFIILNLPSYVVRIHVFVLSVRDDPIPDHVLLLQRYFMLLYYTNFAVNFLLYNLGSRIFRRMMKQYLSSKWSTFSSLFRGLRTDDSSIPPTTTNASSLKANGHAVRQQKRAHDT
ncbi:hypothetical protein HPB48_019131 [Haemaphysalis longicornis]|uniref:G-protein coupled receptors family 1 profile domain-containing protein n=1 Tax=Haemaphysalis longicornis TaxID=44386 RepID=A0A9J6GXX9_HAELO|nr:hypothetical protein HPB48_019131 [Haemaphysalis longicornis]